LVSNADIINYFIEGAMRLVRFETQWQEAKSSHIILEAIIEDLDAKVEVFSQLAKMTDTETAFFTNTSSIPIHVLNEKANLQNRIVGFHFYNPPLIQKLVELIIPSKTHARVKSLAKELVDRLGKVSVLSKDVAGFIGNGHFTREALFACEKVAELSRIHTLPQAIYMVDKVSRDFLIRPMGVFQLLDYVGIDVFYRVCEVMSAYIPEEIFQDPLIDKMISMECFGGQYADGSQKNGFFRYENHAQTGVHSFSDETYLPFKEGNWLSKCDTELGNLPKGHISWKKLQKDPEAVKKIQNYFVELAHNYNLGSELARSYLMRSKDIAQKLVQSHVADSLHDVDTVLKNGFYHVYGISDIALPMTLRY
jgi:3-hydroxyacyl-CoA dehydrogenase